MATTELSLVGTPGKPHSFSPKEETIPDIDPIVDAGQYARTGFSETTYNRMGADETTYNRTGASDSTYARP